MGREVRTAVTAKVKRALPSTVLLPAHDSPHTAQLPLDAILNFRDGFLSGAWEDPLLTLHLNSLLVSLS